jgi:hypothetical protein
LKIGMALRIGTCTVQRGSDGAARPFDVDVAEGQAVSGMKS